MMQKALFTHVHNVGRENFVRFRDLSRAPEAQQFIHFLQRLGVPRTKLVTADGVSDHNIAERAAVI